jgi:hypothetical protein
VRGLKPARGTVCGLNPHPPPVQGEATHAVYSFYSTTKLLNAVPLNTHAFAVDYPESASRLGA